MKRQILIAAAVLLAVLSFLLGWRLMPRIWPDIKKKIVYPVFPQMRPEPYVPESNTAFGDSIAVSDSLVYYFYKDYCFYCRDLSPLIAGLPKEITLPDGTVSQVRVIALNKAENQYLDIINDYYEKRGIPEDRRYVPAVVIGDKYLFLHDEIVDQLMDALVHGEGLHTPLLDRAESVG